MSFLTESKSLPDDFESQDMIDNMKKLSPDTLGMVTSFLDIVSVFNLYIGSSWMIRENILTSLTSIHTGIGSEHYKDTMESYSLQLNSILWALTMCAHGKMQHRIHSLQIFTACMYEQQHSINMGKDDSVSVRRARENSKKSVYLLKLVGTLLASGTLQELQVFRIKLSPPCRPNWSMFGGCMAVASTSTSIVDDAMTSGGGSISEAERYYLLESTHKAEFLSQLSKAAIRGNLKLLRVAGIEIDDEHHSRGSERNSFVRHLRDHCPLLEVLEGFQHFSDRDCLDFLGLRYPDQTDTNADDDIDMGGRGNAYSNNPSIIANEFNHTAASRRAGGGAGVGEGRLNERMNQRFTLPVIPWRSLQTLDLGSLIDRLRDVYQNFARTTIEDPENEIPFLTLAIRDVVVSLTKNRFPSLRCLSIRMYDSADMFELFESMCNTLSDPYGLLHECSKCKHKQGHALTSFHVKNTLSVSSSSSSSSSSKQVLCNCFIGNQITILELDQETMKARQNLEYQQQWSQLLCGKQRLASTTSSSSSKRSFPVLFPCVSRITFNHWLPTVHFLRNLVTPTSHHSSPSPPPSLWK